MFEYKWKVGMSCCSIKNNSNYLLLKEKLTGVKGTIELFSLG